MLQLFYKNYQIARNSSTRSCISLSLYGKLHTILHTCGYVDCDYLIALNNTITMAFVTFILDYTPLTTTLRACTLSLHHTQHCAFSLCNDASAMTMRARFGLTVSSTATTTRLARDIFTNFYFLLTSMVNFFQSQFDFDAEISTSKYTTCRTTASSKARESCTESAPPKKISKNAAKLGEYIIHIHATLSIASLHTGHTELVIAGLLIWITEDIIRFCSLFKLLLSFFVTRVTVWMIFEG